MFGYADYSIRVDEAVDVAKHEQRVMKREAARFFGKRNFYDPSVRSGVTLDKRILRNQKVLKASSIN